MLPLREYANKKGYNIDYDNVSKQVSVTNPLTNQNFKFVSGQGSDYGMGYFNNGINYVTDENKINQAFTQTPGAYNNAMNMVKAAGNTFLPNPAKQAVSQMVDQTQNTIAQTPIDNIMPQQTEQNYGFTPQYRDERQQLIEQTGQQINQGFEQPIGQDQFVDMFNQMLGGFNQQYDPNTDPALAQAQQQAMTAVQNRFAANNMLYSEPTKAMMMQEAQKLVPEYTKMFYMNQQNQINNLLKIGEFGRQINSDSYKMYTDSINNSLTMYDMYNSFDNQDFSIFKENVQLMKNEVETQLKEREQMLKEQDALYNRAKNRVEDVGYVDNESSVILGLPVGTLSRAARERLEANEDYLFKENVKLEAEKEKINYQTQKTLKTIAAQEAKEKRMTDYKNKNEKEKAKLTYKNYFDVGMDMKKALIKNEDEENVRRFTDEDIFDWISGLAVDDETKVDLLKDIGIPDDILSNEMLDQRLNMLFGSNRTATTTEEGE